MKYFFDTEFVEDGKTIDLISIGVVAENGREYYAISNEFDFAAARANKWVNENVLSKLPTCDWPPVETQLGISVWKPREQIARELVTFVSDNSNYEKSEFYAYFADYDWVVLCQLFGTMMNLPKHWPMYCLDLKQIMYHFNVKKDDLPKQEGAEHDALADARWNRAAFSWLSNHIHGLCHPGFKL